MRTENFPQIRNLVARYLLAFSLYYDHIYIQNNTMSRRKQGRRRGAENICISLRTALITNWIFYYSIRDDISPTYSRRTRGDSTTPGHRASIEGSTGMISLTNPGSNLSASIWALWRHLQNDKMGRWGAMVLILNLASTRDGSLHA